LSHKLRGKSQAWQPVIAIAAAAAKPMRAVDPSSRPTTTHY
jgi:hypothetical protein